MTEAKALPTLERLRELLDYDERTGDFSWRTSRGGQRAGAAISTKPNSFGYRRIAIDSISYRAHRLAWLYVHGVEPRWQIDHIDGDPANNRIANLRDVPEQVNHQNLRMAKRGRLIKLPLGVRKHRHKFVASISLDGETTYIGIFTTAEGAHAAYLAAKRQFHEGCTI